ncbi:hypothetical protein WJX73_005392 [Symbiochloris irregularis]|uniref:Pseudouridine synthase n=1 Tax=Symbiochloris irregularis TaxID=706552 RepID=A0AAW1NLR5_9CHLO
MSDTYSLSRFAASWAFSIRPEASAPPIDCPGQLIKATVDAEALSGQAFFRLDVFLAQHLQSGSRAKAAAYIQGGHVKVDGQQTTKSAHRLKEGQHVTCILPPPEPLGILPEDIPLEVVFEDDHLLVVNKPAGMVMHPSPGHMTSGTLVNALLHRWQRPPIVVEKDFSVAGVSGTDHTTDDDDEASTSADSRTQALLQALRPGIVHRLDKGTTGLVVVAKHDAALAHLSAQFKQRTVHRKYVSLLVGLPAQQQGVIETNLGRHLKDRKLMATYPSGGPRGRQANSTFQVLDVLANGRAAVVTWKLGTGRTHQIRVHAKHMGTPIFGDDMYGGTGKAVAIKVAGTSTVRQGAVHTQLASLGRPALHARELGFEHPYSGSRLHFAADKPPDFTAAESLLRALHATS